MIVKIKRLGEVQLPQYKMEGDACLDCYVAREVTIPAHRRAVVPLGFAIEIPQGYEGVIRPRSGLSSKGVDVCIGTIDSGYRGEVCATVVNNFGEALTCEAGSRICQLAIREAPAIVLQEVDELSDTERGGNGFGSTGIN